MKKSRDTITYSKTTFGCLLLLLGTVICYLYFLNVSVIQVVLRTEYQEQQSYLQTEIALLEARYIEAQHQIAARIATIEGFDHDVEKVFISPGGNNFAARTTE